MQRIQSILVCSAFALLAMTDPSADACVYQHDGDGVLDWEHCADIQTAREEEPTSFFDNTQVVVDDPNVIQIRHGSTCMEADNAEDDATTLVSESNLPAWSTNHVVFLQGWKANYNNGDHHVRSIKAIIQDEHVMTEPSGTKQLNFAVVGHLADQNGDDGFQLCVKYTVLSWRTIQMFKPLDPNGDYASRSTHSSFVTRRATFPSLGTALTLRGFRVRWSPEEDVDHTLYTHGYDMDALGSIRAPEASLHDDCRRNNNFEEWSTPLEGMDVHYYATSTPILHEDPEHVSNCDTSGDAPRQAGVIVIRGIPHPYAIPVLSGWKLTYKCDDHNVEEKGIFLDSFQYDYDGQTGTLRLTFFSWLTDDGNNGHFSDIRVNVLALEANNRVGLGSPSGPSQAPTPMPTLAPTPNPTPAPTLTTRPHTSDGGNGCNIGEICCGAVSNGQCDGGCSPTGICE